MCNPLTEGDENARSEIRHARQMNRADRPWTKLDGSICRSESGANYFFAAFSRFQTVLGYSVWLISDKVKIIILTYFED